MSGFQEPEIILLNNTGYNYIKLCEFLLTFKFQEATFRWKFNCKHVDGSYYYSFVLYNIIISVNCKNLRHKMIIIQFLCLKFLRFTDIILYNVQTRIKSNIFC